MFMTILGKWTLSIEQALTVIYGNAKTSPSSSHGNKPWRIALSNHSSTIDASYLRRATMLTGLDILLARMKTAPEEFLKDDHVPYEGELFGGKWADLLDYAWRVANEEERQVLDDARKEFYRDDFNERVMKRLAGEEQEREEHPMQKFRIKTTAQNAAAQAIKNPIQHAAAQQTRVQISNGGTGGTISSQHWTDPRASMLGQQALQNNQHSGGGGFGQAQTGATISTDSSFWNGVITSGKGKLW